MDKAIDASDLRQEESSANGSPLDPSPLQYRQKQEFLIECMKENLGHARHVENERLTFISLLLVGIGMILEFASNLENIGMKILLCLILFALNYICTRLLQRWNDIFIGHTVTAQKIMSELDQCYKDSPPLNIPSLGDFGPANRLYYFDNKFVSGKTKSAKQQEKISPEEAEDNQDAAPKEYRYTRTAKYFYLFNGLVYVILLIFLINSLIEWLA